jgi:radical SAM superfamily enzyme YgiQ (UPF0313 family)
MKKIAALVECDDVVGITAMSLLYPDAVAIGKALKGAYPYKFIMLGGVHATVAHEEVLQSGAFDAAVVGEGETAILKVLKMMERGIYFADGAVDLNGIPPLKYELLDGHRPKMSYGKHQAFMPILTSRGCPFNCSFCCRIFGRKYRTMSTDKVMGEIKRLQNCFNIKEIKFYDDVFTLDRARAIELSDRIGGSISWTCQTRVNLVDRPTLRAMRRGGCYCVSYGIESADPAILKSISKSTTIEQVEQAVRYSKESGLRVIGYFMLGAPGETLETIKKTVDFAISSGIDHAQFSIATALPGSELYELVPERLRANSYAVKGADNPSLCELSPAQLKEALGEANRRFKRGK